MGFLDRQLDPPSVNRAQRIVSFVCGWCGARTTEQCRQEHNTTRGYAAMVICQAQRCGRANLVHESNGSYALLPHSTKPYAEDGVPPAIARDFSEALGCRGHDYLVAAAIVGRRVLEATVQEKGAASGNLAARINSLSDDLIPAPYKQKAHQVRLIGNMAAHGDQVQQADVDDLLEFVALLLDLVYVKPQQLADSQARRTPGP